MAENEKIEVGDVVILNSGGPEMTVWQVEDNLVNCQWFTVTQEKVTSATFVMNTISIVKKR